jgi:hypothetical protein
MHSTIPVGGYDRKDTYMLSDIPVCVWTHAHTFRETHCHPLCSLPLRKRRILNPEPKLNFVADLQSEIERYEAVMREAAEEGIDMVEEEVNPSILHPQHPTLKSQSSTPNSQNAG